MTNNLERSARIHKENIINGNNTFASRYNIEFLVLFFENVLFNLSKRRKLKLEKREEIRFNNLTKF
jgi:putative endonuclease